MPPDDVPAIASLDEARRRRALEALAREHHGFLMSFARKLCGQIDEPADLVQDVLEKAVRTPERIPADGTRNWLVRVMRNTFIDRLRHHGATPRHDAIDDTQVAAPIVEAPAWWTALDADDIRARVGELPDDQRAVFELFAFGHLSYQEIATRLGIPKATVGTRILRARRRLRELFAAPERQADE